LIGFTDLPLPAVGKLTGGEFRRKSGDGRGVPGGAKRISLVWGKF
jgi:hypothetical protein